jgi:hypothetical protein
MDLEVKDSPHSDEIRRLEEEHRHYAEKLEGLLQKPYLSEDEKIEEVRLKKLKLYLKDQMMARRNPRAGAYTVA